MYSLRIETTTSSVKHHNKTQIVSNISEDIQNMLKSRKNLHKALKETVTKRRLFKYIESFTAKS